MPPHKTPLRLRSAVGAAVSNEYWPCQWQTPPRQKLLVYRERRPLHKTFVLDIRLSGWSYSLELQVRQRAQALARARSARPKSTGSVHG